MVVSHNVPALFSHLSMRRADRGLSQAMQRLSTGTRINSAREDAAGLAIANKLNYQVGGLNRASDNATHGIALIQTAEGALNEVHGMLQRMRELAVQASTDTLNNQQKAMIQYEIDQLTAEMQKISTRTEYNRMRVLNGEADRVTESTPRTAAGPPPVFGAPVRNITSSLFISAAVQPGHLDYTIDAVGQHAVQPIALPWIPTATGTVPAGQAGSIAINGVPVTFSEGQEWSSVAAEFNQALDWAGVTPHISGAGDVYLVSNIAGRNQHITFTGADNVLNFLTVPNNVPVRGTDAQITINGLRDINGQDVPGSDTLSVHAEGNKIFIRGSQGEDIRINVQVNFDPDIPGFHFPGETTAAGARDMGLQIRSFGPLMLQIGPSHNTAMPVQIPRVNAETLGIVEFVGGLMRPKLNYANTEHAVNALAVVDRAINTVSNVRSRLGAYQNRLESTIRSLDVAAENTEMSRSRIQDTDMARESTRFAQYNVMYQAALAILGQANQRPHQLIQLLQ